MEAFDAGSPAGHRSRRSSRKALPSDASRMSSTAAGGETVVPARFVSFLVAGLFAATGFSLPALRLSGLLVPVDIFLGGVEVAGLCKIE